jgi:hypothetical protein
MNRFLLLFALALALAPLAAAAGASPLQQRLIGPGEIAGYTPLAAHTYDFAGYARAAGLDPQSKAKLSHAGFVASAVENLRAPSALPKEAGPSQSSVLELGSTQKASAFATWLKKTYYDTGGGRPLPAGVHWAAFTIPNERQAFGLHFWGQTKQGRLDEFNAIVVHGRYLDEIDLYVKGSRITTRQATTEFAAHFNPLAHN